MAYDDCTKVYHLDSDDRPVVLDVIMKPLRQTMDLQLSKDSSYLYCLDSTNFLGNAGGDPSAAIRNVDCSLGLYFVNVNTINLDPTKARKAIKHELPKSQPRAPNAQNSAYMS